MHTSIENARLDYSPHPPTAPRGYALADTIEPMGSLRGDRVREQRKAHGWTQTELAERAHVGQGTLSRIERGESENSIASTVAKLAKALGCTQAYLMGETDTPTSELQTVATSEARPAAAMRPEYEQLAVDVLEHNPDISERAIEAIGKSGSMQSLGLPLNEAALRDLAMVVQRHAVRKPR